MMNSLDRLLPKEEAGIMKAVLLGDKTGLTDEIKSDFHAAGTYHLLVVSGVCFLCWVFIIGERMA